jgi:SAM-dependent methyltransferase
MSQDGTWSASFASASGAAMRVYDDVMVPRMFQPWAELLLTCLGVTQGQAVLDVACGPGTVSGLAARRVGPGGRVTGCDLSSAMVSIARAKPPSALSAPVEYLQCPADALRVSDASYDVAACQQGLQFFADRGAALDEMHRALRPQGRVGIAVWCAIEECPPFACIASAVGKVLGGERAAAYRNGPWGLTDGDELYRLVTDAGFVNVRVERHQLPVVFDGGPAQLLDTLAASSLANDVTALAESERQGLLRALYEAARPLLDAGAVRSRMTSHLVIAET